ncbi:MAG: 23S rRNA (uracil1939-C5)-methyltransferase [bacterium P3]|nr:MAG: 23S rRNA (uracil1939-C5)-methyltransferase [bacterium P3]KWW40490.1 MAG: 23S rRNA (uracil1939-C5)-methyltransferase [bacterium F083]
MSRKKNLPILTDVAIADIGAEGKAVARVDGMVIFVPFVVPGDVVDIQLTRKKKNYAEGRAVAFKHYAERRVETRCPHFGTCGGCRWQTVRYDDQLAAKEKQVRDTLERLGHVDCSGMRPISGSPEIYEYRNKLEFTFSNRRWRTDPGVAEQEEWGALGFHIPGLFDKVLDIDHCALQREPSNAIRNAIREYAREHALTCYDIRNHTGFLRNVVVRCSNTGQWMVIVIVAERDESRLFGLLDHLAAAFPEITSLQYIVNEKWNDSYTDLPVICYRGEDHIVEEMPRYYSAGMLRFKITPKSFFQTNSRQAQQLYRHVAELAGLQGDEVVYDLYTGTGTIAHFLAEKCRKVIGIEYVDDAIADARTNAILNHHDNTVFFTGDMALALTDKLFVENGHPDVVIADPPRAGMHASVIAKLLETAPRKIVYVSCNPATQARDLELLSARYDVGCIQPVDMFPHTQHVENVVELTLRNGGGPEQR